MERLLFWLFTLCFWHLFQRFCDRPYRLRHSFFLPFLVQFPVCAAPLQLLPPLRFYKALILHPPIPKQPVSVRHGIPAHNTVFLLIWCAGPDNLLYLVFFCRKPHALKQLCSILLCQLCQLLRLFQICFLYRYLPQLICSGSVLIKCYRKGKIILPVSRFFYPAHRLTWNHFPVMACQDRNHNLLRKRCLILDRFVCYFPVHGFRAHLQTANHTHLHQNQCRPECRLDPFYCILSHFIPP